MSEHGADEAPITPSDASQSPFDPDDPNRPPFDPLSDLESLDSPVHERLAALGDDGVVLTNELLDYLRFLERTYQNAAKRPGLGMRERGMCAGGVRACQLIRRAVTGRPGAARRGK